MGRLGSVTLGVADIGSVFTGFGQILVGTGLGTGKVLPASTVQGYTLVAVSTAIDPSGLQWQQADWLSGDVKTTTALVIPEGWLDGNGQAVSRSVYSQLCASTTIATTGLMTHGNSVISSIPSSQVVFMAVGQPIEAPGQFPSGTTVTAILSGTSISVSNNATGTGGTQPFTVFPNGNGDGSTTFNVINLYGKVPVGWNGSGGYGIGQSFGSASVVLSQSQLPSHGHSISQSPHNHANSANTSTEIDTHTHPFSGDAWQAQTVYLQPGSSSYSLVTAGGGPPTSTESESQTHYHNFTDGLVNANVSINLTGGSAPVSLYQPSAVVRYLVKT
jgi:microcystin-dependent protein